MDRKEVEAIVARARGLQLCMVAPVLARLPLAFTALTVLVTLSACRAPAATPPPAPTATLEPAPPPLEEDEDGVIGGPRDASQFEFEPALSDDTPPPVLTGVPELSPAIQAALVPYLDARRVRLSHVASDGSRMLVLTREGATTQVYSLGEPLAPLEPLTFGAEPVVQASPVPGRPGELVFRRDHGGDEDHQIYLRVLGTGVEHLLTDGASRHGPFRLSNGAGAPLVAFTGNRRAESDLDIYLSTLEPEAPILAIPRDGQWIVLGWTGDGQHLLLRRYWSIERSMIYLANLDDGAVEPLVDALDTPDEASFIDARFNQNGELDLLGDFGEDFVAVHTRGLDGQWRQQTPVVHADVEAFTRQADGTLIYATNDDGASRLFARLAEQAPRELALPHGAVLNGLRSAGSGRLAFTLTSATRPSDAYLLDRREPDNPELVQWTRSLDSALDPAAFVEPTTHRAMSSDGLEVPMLVYRPRGDGPFPALLWMHGGPEDQSRPVFNPIIQYFVRRGIAIIAPNVRGSDGYGRRFRGLDDGVLRDRAIEDVGAVLDWLETQPEIDTSRVGIHGVSYGGFMVLASLAAYPERFVAGCDVVGITNFVTFLENTRPYRQALRRPEYGDERDPEVRAVLERISPINQVDRIEAPLFVAHGANDPRVPVSEAEQIIAALRARDKEVWSMIAPTEGHAFKQRINRDTFYVAMIMFFERHLFEPPTDAGIDELEGGLE